MIFLKTKVFDRQLRRAGLADDALKDAISEFLGGLHDGQLGRHLFKKRVACHGRGKRGGARTILFFKKEEKLIFLHVFLKNQKSDIQEDERCALQRLADIFDLYSKRQIEMMIDKGVLIEIQ